MIRYLFPGNWIQYDAPSVASALIEAKATILALRSIPYQRAWVDALQKMELKREVAGTSRIEGAEFTEKELDAALRETAEQLHTRSQRQAHAAMLTYKWIANLADDRPITDDLIREIHRRIVTGADDDHCAPGQIRRRDENVTFGAPRHRGAVGGDEVTRAFAGLVRAIQREFRDHDPLIQALAAHYHFAAMHPFLDGNGRTARALEALLLQRAGLRDTCFIAMSNYYYDEKTSYLSSLAAVQAARHDLTSFLIFALKGIAQQSRRLLGEIQHQISKELFRNLMHSLFNRLHTPKRRVIARRQIEILNVLLEHESLNLVELFGKTEHLYSGLKNTEKALLRDLNELVDLRAIRIVREDTPGPERIRLSVHLEWPSEFTETELFAKLKKLPKSKTHGFLA